jgi:hypothetical protein
MQPIAFSHAFAHFERHQKMSANVLITAMAAKCRALIQEPWANEFGLPKALRPQHLLWMCNQIEEHADDWPPTKLHRWIGFIQCGMIVNRILDLDGLKKMFDDVKNAYGGNRPDFNLIDHLDSNNPFEMEIGGQG